MNEKLVKLGMGFGEALARLAKTPKSAIANLDKHKKPKESFTGESPSPSVPQKEDASKGKH